MAKLKNIEKPTQGKKTFFRLVSYLSNEYKLLTVVFLLILVSIAANLGGSYMLRPIINNYIMPGDIVGLIKMLFLLGGVYLSGVIAVFIQNRLLIKVGQRTVLKLRVELFKKMETLPIKYFDTHQHGDLMSRYTNDIDKISDVLTDSLADLFTSIVTLAGILLIMIYISPMLTLIVLIMVPIMFLGASRIVKQSRKSFAAQQQSLGEVNGYIEEMISGAKVVKVFGHAKKVEKDFNELNDKLRGHAEKSQIFSGMMMPFIQNLNTLNFVFITVVGALLAIFRGFDVGGLAAFLQYSRQFGGPINEIAMLYNNLQAALAGAERIFQIIDTPSEADEAVGEIKDVKGDLDICNVCFAYDVEKPVLKDISLQISQGERIALVGTTGAGKTTIFNMLPRFYDIGSGDIRIDGVSIFDMKKTDLRHSMAIVLQDTHLFTDTVRENIRFGRLDATDDEVEEAARLAAAHSFIRRLPQGYSTMLENDGANLSQGQRQLLNIARAAIANPPILLLDEATSNIDTRSELKIQKGLDKLMEGRTSIIIAHRLSTVRNVDRIYVLEHGQIVEYGSHDELIAKEGKYYSLYEEQFK